MSKELIGIGGNPNVETGHIHLVAKGEGKTGVAFCDKRTKGLEPNGKLTAADVTCAKCMEYRAFKDMIDPDKPNVPPDGDLPPDTKKTTGKKVKKTPEEIAEEAATAADKKSAAKKKPEPKKKAKAKTKKMEPYIDFAAVPNNDGTYVVKHIPSGRDFFDSIPSNVIAFALDALNSLPVRWQQDKPLPDDYVSLVRDTIKTVYKERKVRPPKHLTRPMKKQKKKKPAKPPKGVKIGDRKKSDNDQWMEFNGKRWVNVQKITRRKKPEKDKRVIKRRGKSPDDAGTAKRTIVRREAPAGLNKYGQVADKPPALITSHLENGAHLSEIISDLQDKFGMTEKRAMSKFRAICRKMARRLGITITHIIMGDPSNDYYHIAEDE